ncbi:hypothetical protein PR048_013118 [Dryococelus australis]|uniref:Uncharacterized protein n=1 Tax=Dryococelus australis TaxID=614101 RepID=A0ABQ9HR99_9NEOP|nr:hypothetical protein PR048_013118 [Dryococelus australis]
MLQSFCVHNNYVEETISVTKALKGDYADEWHDVMKIELYPGPPDRTMLGSKCVLKLKKNTDGTVSRFKARLVAQGFAHTTGTDSHTWTTNSNQLQDSNFGVRLVVTSRQTVTGHRTNECTSPAKPDSLVDASMIECATGKDPVLSEVRKWMCHG